VAAFVDDVVVGGKVVQVVFDGLPNQIGDDTRFEYLLKDSGQRLVLIGEVLFDLFGVVEQLLTGRLLGVVVVLFLEGGDALFEFVDALLGAVWAADVVTAVGACFLDECVEVFAAAGEAVVVGFVVPGVEVGFAADDLCDGAVGGEAGVLFPPSSVLGVVVGHGCGFLRDGTLAIC